MRKLIWLLFIFATITGYAQTRLYKNVKSDYHRITKFNNIEITPQQTIANVTFRYYPNYWINISSESCLKESNGDRVYKMTKLEGFPVDKNEFMPASGEVEATMFFEPVDADVKLVDFIASGEDENSQTYGIRLTDEVQQTKLPESFYGTWITTDGTNRWVYGFNDNVVLMANKIWDYNSVVKKGNTTQVTLNCEGTMQVLNLKQLKNGNLLVSRGNEKSFTEYGREFLQSKSTDSAWVFSPEKYYDSIFKPGKAVLCGYLDHYTPKLGFTTSLLHIEDCILRQSKSKLMQIEPDGRFYVEVDLDCPTSAYFEEGKMVLTLFPGDTILLYSDMIATYDPKYLLSRENVSLKYMSNNRSAAEINNFTPLFNKVFPSFMIDYNDIMTKAKNCNPEEMLSMRDPGLNQVKMVQDSASIVFSNYNLTNYAKDAIYTSLLVRIVANICDIDMLYMQNKYIQTEDSTGVTSVTLNSAYVPMDNFFDFCPSLKSSIFENVLCVTTSPFSQFINRIEYSVIANQSAAMANIKTSKLAEQNIPEDYWHRIIENECANKSFKIWQGAGLDKCLIYDYILSRHISMYYRDDDVKDGMLEMISAKLPYIKTPHVAGKLVQFYADNAQPKIEQTSDGPKTKADEILDRIIAPYKGNVLYLDFWSTSCGPCRSGMIDDKKKIEQLKNNKIKFLYITDETQSPMDAYTQFLTENNIKGEQIRISKDDWNHLASKLKINGIPHHTVIDKYGKIVKNTRINSIDELLELEKK